MDKDHENRPDPGATSPPGVDPEAGHERPLEKDRGWSSLDQDFNLEGVRATDAVNGPISIGDGVDGAGEEEI